MNKVIIKKKFSGRYFTKDGLFDIQSLVDQFYCSSSIIFNGFMFRKIYFSENLVPNLLKEGIKQLYISVLLAKLKL